MENNCRVDNKAYSNNNYISCIKINGISILPPLMNHERRAEMRYYKELAIKVEESLKSRKPRPLSDSSDGERSTTYFNTDKSSHSDSLDNMSDRSEENVDKSHVSFSESCREDVLFMLSDDVRNKTAIDVPLTGTQKAKLPLAIPSTSYATQDNSVDRLRKCPIRQDSYTVERNEQMFSDDLLKSFACETICDKSTEAVDVEDESTNLKTIKTPRPIRSKSFTLDSPSPLLLAQIEKMTDSTNFQCVGPQQTNSNHKRRSWDLTKAKQKWPSIENDIGATTSNDKMQKKRQSVPNIKSKYSSLPTSSATSPNAEMFDSSKTPDRRKTQMRVPVRSTSEDSPRRIVRAITTALRVPHVKTAERELSPRDIKDKLVPPSPIVKTDLLKKPNIKLSNESNRLRSPNVAKRRVSAPQIHDKTVINKLSATKLKLTPKKSLDSSTNNSPDSGEKNKSDALNGSKDYIYDIFNKIQSEQSKKMSELLSKQKEEQEKLVNLFAHQQNILISKIQEAYSSPSITPEKTSFSVEQNGTKKRTSDHQVVAHKKLSPNESVYSDSILCSTSSQTVCYTLNSSNDTLADPNLSLKSNEIASPAISKSQNGSISYQITTNYPRSASEESLEVPTFISISNGNGTVPKKGEGIVLYKEAQRNGSCSRQLFPTAKQVWAATILCAATRGFLVRRLMRTARVQNLIKTIRDALIVAMKVHQDSIENILPSDVVFHRHLIQQITATCVQFHDVFFRLSIPDQMAVITVDRERLRERQSRPTNSRNGGSLSSATQRVLERKMRKDSPDASISSSRSARSCRPNSSEFRNRAKSVSGESPDKIQSKRCTPQSCPMRRTMSFISNKKPWR